MDTSKYYYLKDKLMQYDINFRNNFYFEYESEETQKLKEVKNSRFLLSNSYNNGLYLASLTINDIDNGFMLCSAGCEVLLHNVGNNIFYLSSYKGNKNALKSILRTFIDNYDCFVDVTTFKFLFVNECEIIKIFK